MTDLHPFEDPRRSCLPVEQWPEVDRRGWESALRDGDLIEGTVGAGFHWADATRRSYAKTYGRWLTFLIQTGRFAPQREPADRVTPETVREYEKELARTVASWTVWGRLSGLLAVIKALAPAHDWSWLRRVVRRYEAKRADSRNKLQRLRSAEEIVAWASDEMESVRRAPPNRNAAGRYRDALTIGLLILCPIRLRNLTMIRLGTHLIGGDEAYRLTFARNETKTATPLSLPVPDIMTAFLDHYIRELRPLLLEDRESDRLWITQYGKPMRDRAVYDAIIRTTKRAFGTAINPHLFRDCAVTFVALNDPRHIGIASPILGHTDPRAAEKHYVQANQLSAGRRLAASIDNLRATLSERLPRASKRGRSRPRSAKSANRWAHRSSIS